MNNKFNIPVYINSIDKYIFMNIDNYENSICSGKVYKNRWINHINFGIIIYKNEKKKQI